MWLQDQLQSDRIQNELSECKCRTQQVFKLRLSFSLFETYIEYLFAWQIANK